jgi:tRNA-dihydrouridine synthase B
VRMREHTGCDAVMIGRGAQGNPWLFHRLREIAEGRPDPGEPTLPERIAVFRRHTELMRRLKGGPKLIHELRKACAWYARGLHGCNHFRKQVWSIDQIDPLLEAAEAYFQHLLDYQARRSVAA